MTRYSEAEILRAAADGERSGMSRRGLSGLLDVAADLVEQGDPRVDDIDAAEVMADLNRLISNTPLVDSIDADMMP